MTAQIGLDANGEEQNRVGDTHDLGQSPQPDHTGNLRGTDAQLPVGNENADTNSAIEKTTGDMTGQGTVDETDASQSNLTPNEIAETQQLDENNTKEQNDPTMDAENTAHVNDTIRSNQRIFLRTRDKSNMEAIMVTLKC